MKCLEIVNISNREKELILYGDIVSEKPWFNDSEDLFITPSYFLEQMDDLKGAEKITVRLNSGGGSVYVALAIYNYLKELSAEKIVVIDGICASAATVIAMAGDIVKIPKTALFMIHDTKLLPYAYIGISDLDKIKSQLESGKKAIISAYQSKVSLSNEELSEMMSKETWMTGEDAVKNGFADELVENTTNIGNAGEYLLVNNLEIDIRNYKNLPQHIEKIKNLAPDNKGVEDIKNENIGGNEEMTTEKLKNEYPDIYNQVYEDGVKAERGRIQEIEAISNVVDSELLNKAKYVEPISARDLAFENMKLENKVGTVFLQNQKNDYNSSGAENVGVDPTQAHLAENTTQKNNVSLLVDLMNKDKRRG